MRFVKLALFMLAALAIGATAASAAPIIGTGFTSAGTPGTPGNGEGNWSVIDTTNGTGPLGLTIVTDECCYGGAWADPGSLTAKWITPFPGGTLAIDGGSHFEDTFYEYTLAFDAPNRDINIKWSSDNNAELFFDNGKGGGFVSLGTTGDTGYGAFQTALLLAGDFGAGNLFKAVVRNLAYNDPKERGNPTGFFLDVGPSPVPLPPAVLLFGSALVGMNWLRRRRTGQELGTARL